VTQAWLWWGAFSSLGVLIILLPDTGRRLFSLSEEHGPSLADGLGILLLVAGWVVLDIATWRRRRVLAIPRGVLAPMAIVTIVSGALVVWSVAGDHASWWIVGAVLLATVQVAAAFRVTVVERRERETRRREQSA
jgi:hypothetical protein